MKERYYVYDFSWEGTPIIDIKPDIRPLVFFKGIYFNVRYLQEWSVRQFKLLPGCVQGICSIGKRPNSSNQPQAADNNRPYFKLFISCPFLLTVRPVWFSQVVILSGWLISSASGIVGSYLLVEGLIAPLHDRRRISIWRTFLGVLFIGVFLWITFHQDDISEFAVGQ